MKVFIHIVFLFTMIMAIRVVYGQKKSRGYAYLQPSFYIKNNWSNKFALNAGAGYCPSRLVGFGGGFNAYVFKSDQEFANMYADIRPFIVPLDKVVSYYVSVQPGYVFYNKSIRIGNELVKSTGGPSADILIGMIGRPAASKSMGMTLNIGYSMLSFKSSGETTYYHGFKIQGGIAF